MWHLDMFALLVAPNFILLPLLPSGDIIENMKDGTKKRFFQNLQAHESKLVEASLTFEKAGLKVKHIDGYQFDAKDCLVAMYFNGITGFTSSGEPFIMLADFSEKYNRLFLLELRLAAIKTKVFFIGDPLENLQELTSLGGSFRCQTSC